MKSALLVVTIGCLLSRVHALASSFEHDGKTTYCWFIPQSFTVKQAKWTDKVLEAQTGACPVRMELSINVTEVQVGEFVPVEWVVTLDRSGLKPTNPIKADKLYRTVDKNTGEHVEIIHSNVHSCEFGSNCDPFRMGNKFVDHTPNQVASFDGKDVVRFESTNELVYTQPGLYSVLAHIILPGANDNVRYDYAVYTRLNVVPKETTTTTSTASTNASTTTTTAPPTVTIIQQEVKGDDSGMSSSAVAIIIVGCIAIVALVGLLVWFLRRKDAKTNNAKGQPGLSLMTDLDASQTQSASHPEDNSFDYHGAREVDIRVNSPLPMNNPPPQPAPYRSFGGDVAAGRSPEQRSPPRAQVPPRQTTTQLPPFRGPGATTTQLPPFRGPGAVTAVNRNGPTLYNREMSSFHYGDSTRSFQYQDSDRRMDPLSATQQIVATNNSVDFVYPDTDRSMGTTQNKYNYTSYDDDSTRSFDLDTNDSYDIYTINSHSSSRVFDNDSFAHTTTASKPRRSYLDEEDEGITDTERHFAYDSDVDTRDLSTQDRRRIHVAM